MTLFKCWVTMKPLSYIPQTLRITLSQWVMSETVETLWVCDIIGPYSVLPRWRREAPTAKKFLTETLLLFWSQLRKWDRPLAEVGWGEGRQYQAYRQETTRYSKIYLPLKAFVHLACIVYLGWWNGEDLSSWTNHAVTHSVLTFRVLRGWLLKGFLHFTV